VTAPFVLAIDVEPAPRHRLLGIAAEWESFARCVEHLARWRDSVLDRTGRPLRITWFMRCDPQMSAYGSEDWPLHHFGAVIERLKAQGDAFGLHVHPFRRIGGGAWRQDFTDEPAICDMVAAGVELYERTLGRPRYFRMGEGWLSDAIVSRLEALGVEYDLTVEPGFGPRPFPAPDIGTMADYRGAPRLPYRPSRHDVRTPDELGGRALRIVPVSTACLDHPPVLHPASEAHRVEKLHLSFDPAFIRPFIDVALASGGLTVAVTRTGDLAWSKHLLGNFDYLLGHADLDNVAVEPPASAVERHDRAGATPRCARSLRASLADGAGGASRRLRA
jgi:hypothetical protein